MTRFPRLEHCLTHRPRGDAIADQQHLGVRIQVGAHQVDLVAMPLDLVDEVAVEALDTDRVFGQITLLVVRRGGKAQQVRPAKGAHRYVLVRRRIVTRLEKALGIGDLALADGIGDEIADLDSVHRGCDLFVGQDKDRAAKALGQVKGAHGERVTVGHRGRAEDDDRVAARGAPADKLRVSLGGGRRPTGGRPHALHVDDDQRHFAHDGQPNVLRVEADARSAGRGQDAAAGHSRADAKAERGDLVLALHGHAAHARQVAHHAQQDGRRRGDGIPGEKVATGGQRPADDGRVAVDEFSHRVLCTTHVLDGSRCWVMALSRSTPTKGRLRYRSS